ncbi:unnamed protein product [Lactuca saligna]|uniref:EF-hand domain-containing protein n=1 Tax=Lactuca saligna TaxID=75948 RepID=A0AA36E227_LACSI|nr:unnamed protein product [Lactuca saligna]
MQQANQSDSETEATGSDMIPRRKGNIGSENMTEYEKQRMKRIEENKARMRAMGLDKMASSFMGSVPVSRNANKKGKQKVGLEDDEEYKPPVEDDELSSASESDGDDYDDELHMSRTKPKVKNSTPSKKISKLSENSDFVGDDDDDALMKAIALSLQDSPGFLDVTSKTPPQKSDSKVSHVEKKQIVRKDDSGNRKRKNWFASRVQMTEDELILHFFQFDEVGKGGIGVRDLRRVAASHDFTWTDEEMGDMIQFFDSNGDGKLSLEDFTKIVERCHMRQGLKIHNWHHEKIRADISLEVEEHPFPFPPNAMRRKLDSRWLGGFSLGIDLGLSRTGLAISKGFSVRPLKVLELRGQKLEKGLLEIAQEQEVDEFIIGLPVSSDGKETPQSNKVRSVAGRIAIWAAERGWRVYLQDEHGTSTDAMNRMINLGLNKSDRKQSLDAYAAMMVLERYFSESGERVELVLPKQLELQEKLRKGPQSESDDDVDFF